MAQATADSDQSQAARPGAEASVVHRRRSQPNAPWPIGFYRTAVGKKWVMALSGVVLLGYVLVHMLGNMKVYLGPEEINSYGESLRDLGGHLVPRTNLLWLMRIGLILAFAVHIHSAYSLTRMNITSRPERYQGGRDYIAANFASRTMRWTGIIVALYLAYHLADLTWGWTNPDFIRGDVYHNMVESFSRWPVAILYIVANIALTIHIYHGAWSIFQSLGINNPRYNEARRVFAGAFAFAIGAGNVLFPIMVLTGVIG